MKKVLCIVLLLALCFSWIPVAVAEEQVVYGDVNGDALINAKDALLILRYTVNKADFTSRQFQAACVTKQPELSAKDALRVLQKSVGKLHHFEAEKTNLCFAEPEKSVYNSGSPCEDFWKEFWANGKGAYVDGAEYINSFEDLTRYAQTYGLTKGYSPESSHELLSLYSEGYFQSSSLILFYGYPKYTGLPQTSVTNVYRVGDELCVEVLESLKTGEICTTDDAHPNLCVVEVYEKMPQVQSLNFYVNFQKQWVNENLVVLEVLENHNKKFEFPVNTVSLLWQQPAENKALVASTHKAFSVSLCHTYEEYTASLLNEQGTALYTKEYFETDNLILVTFTTPHAEDEYTVQNLFFSGKVLYMNWERTHAGTTSSQTETTWQYFVEVHDTLEHINKVHCDVLLYEPAPNGYEAYVGVDKFVAEIPKN